MSPPNSSEALKRFLRKEKLNLDNLSSHKSDDIEGVYQAVRTGLGIGMLLDVSIQQEIDTGSFIAILPEKNLPKKRLYLLYKKNQWQTQKQKAFKEHIKKSLSVS